MKNVENFYNGRVEKCINDYRKANKRLLAAITYSLGWVPNNSKKIIDIGCAVGWATYEMAKHFPKSKVIGVDIASKLISVGKKLFNNLPNMNLNAVDLVTMDISNLQKCDVILLFDVYEHIPHIERKNFHCKVNNMLSDSGIVIITCPTPRAQKYAEIHSPQVLQPVEEYVVLNDLKLFANDIGAHVINYEEKTISREKDYFHAVISRNTWLPRTDKKINIDNKQQRHLRIKNNIKA